MMMFAARPHMSRGSPSLYFIFYAQLLPPSRRSVSLRLLPHPRNASIPGMGEESE